MSELKTMVCPACGASLSVEGTVPSSIKCDRCGCVLQYAAAAVETMTAPARIVPFGISEEKFRTGFYRQLVDTNLVPTDIFERIKVDKIERAFLPVYRVKGSYRVWWTCTEERETTTKRADGSTETETDLQPVSGFAEGMFHFITWAGKTEEIPQCMREFDGVTTYIAPYDSISVPYSAAAIVEKVPVVDTDPERMVPWTNGVRDYLKERAYQAAYKAASYTRDFKCEIDRCNVAEAELVLMSFMCLTYEYNGKRFCYLSDGLGQYVNLKYPNDADAASATALVEKKRRATNIEAAVFALIGIVEAFCLSPSYLLLTLTAILYRGVLYYGFRSELEAINASARTLRNNGMMRFLGNHEHVTAVPQDMPLKKKNVLIIIGGTVIMLLLALPVF